MQRQQGYMAAQLFRTGETKPKQHHSAPALSTSVRFTYASNPSLLAALIAVYKLENNAEGKPDLKRITSKHLQAEFQKKSKWLIDTANLYKGDKKVLSLSWAAYYMLQFVRVAHGKQGGWLRLS